MDLASTFLCVRARVVPAVGANLDTDSVLGPVNNWLHSLFSHVEISLNDTLVTPSTNTYPYLAYIDTLLSYGVQAKEAQFTSTLWYKDTAGHMNATDNANEGMWKRREHIKESCEVEIMGRLHADLLLRDRYLLSGVDVKICLERSNNPGFKITFVEVALHV